MLLLLDAHAVKLRDVIAVFIVVALQPTCAPAHERLQAHSAVCELISDSQTHIYNVTPGLIALTGCHVQKGLVKFDIPHSRVSKETSRGNGFFRKRIIS